MGKKKRSKVRTVILCTLSLLAAGLAVFLWGGYRMFGDEIRAIRTLRMVRPSVYTFTFKGDYGFDGFLEGGGAKTDAQMAGYIASFLSHGFMEVPEPDIPEVGCSSLGCGGLFLRNFDFPAPGNYVIVKAAPKHGYRSISTGNFAFMGAGEDWHPQGGLADGFTALATLYVPLDGMNEKGLCVADLISLNGDPEVRDSPKGDLTVVAAIRLLLDKAADVDEAQELLSRYDVFPSIGRAHHLAVSDAKGNDVVFEWKDGVLLRTDSPAVTNHELSSLDDDPAVRESVLRREKLLGSGRAGSLEEGFSILRSVSSDPDTRWSVVYDKDRLQGTWCFPPAWNEAITVPLP